MSPLMTLPSLNRQTRKDERKDEGQTCLLQFAAVDSGHEMQLLLCSGRTTHEYFPSISILWKKTYRAGLVFWYRLIFYQLAYELKYWGWVSMFSISFIISTTYLF